MLLRRFTVHVKDQNWFAVGLDFLIVVMGVFIGLQVSNWNTGQKDAAKRAAAIEALQIEYEDNIDTLRRAHANYVSRNETEQSMARALFAGEMDTDLITAGFTQIMYFAPLGVRESTYDSLRQSGDLSLIADQDILVALNEFSRRVDWIQAQRSSFRDGMSDLNQEWRDYVFHAPTDRPTVTQVSVDYDRLKTDPRAVSAAVQVTRMKAIFASYIPPLIEEAISTCERLARASGRPCRTAEISS